MASPPFKVKALFEYVSSHEDDLAFDVGQIVTVVGDEDPDWYDGEYVDASGEKQEGIFPRNFVEKYEPTAPPRPSRPRKKEAEKPAELAPEPQAAQEDPPTPASPRLPAEPRSPKSPAAAPQPGRSSQAPPKAPVPSRGGPPPVSEKPATSSFRDRIAAFNKPAAPPIAPFKPSGYSSGNSGFIKKTFVAAPPSRNSYVPPPKDAPPAKVYRRDEDPEIKQREAENLESAEKAGFVPSTAQEGQDEDRPKPTSLKERIALLQRQQAEQAQRHADAAAKKEKPKRPPKPKRGESNESHEVAPADGAEAPPPPPERRSIDIAEEEKEEQQQQQQQQPPPRQALPVRRKSYKDPPEDGNEADMSGAGDTTEGPEDLTEREDSDEKPRRFSHVATGVEQVKAQSEERGEEEEGEEGEEEEGEEEEDDDVDPEVRRKEELRARMAKMSGGMGMMGLNMFGAPAPSAAPKKKKTTQPGERRPSEHAEEPASPRLQAPPVPAMIPIPGMGQRYSKEPEEVAEPEETESAGEEDITPVSTASPRAAAPGGEHRSVDDLRRLSY
jgi:myosin tail region-interacting protein MTI1